MLVLKKLLFLAPSPLNPLSPSPSCASNLKGPYISGHESWIKITEPVTGQPGPTNKQDFMVERKRKVFLGFLGYEDVRVFLSAANQQPVNGIWVYEPFLIRLFLEEERVSEHRGVVYTHNFALMPRPSVNN